MYYYCFTYDQMYHLWQHLPDLYLEVKVQMYLLFYPHYFYCQLISRLEFDHPESEKANEQ